MRCLLRNHFLAREADDPFLSFQVWHGCPGSGWSVSSTKRTDFSAAKWGFIVDICWRSWFRLVVHHGLCFTMLCGIEDTRIALRWPWGLWTNEHTWGDTTLYGYPIWSGPTDTIKTMQAMAGLDFWKVSLLEIPWTIIMSSINLSELLHHFPLNSHSHVHKGPIQTGLLFPVVSLL